MAHQKISAALHDSRPFPFEASEWNAVIAALDMPPREAEVIELVLRGLHDKQIAAALGISTTTVRAKLRRMFTRFKAADRTELILHVFATVRNLNVAPGSHPVIVKNDDMKTSDSRLTSSRCRVT